MIRKGLIQAVVVGVCGLGVNVAGAGSNLEAADKANAPNARVAIAWTGIPDDVARSKGVRKINVPTKGIYCILVNAKSKISDVRKTTPIVSGSAESTTNPKVLAIVTTSSTDCPNKKTWYTVYTYVFNTNDFDLSDAVSWNLVVP